jgi:hypothetical protein
LGVRTTFGLYIGPLAGDHLVRGNSNPGTPGCRYASGKATEASKKFIGSGEEPSCVSVLSSRR